MNVFAALMGPTVWLELGPMPMEKSSKKDVYLPAICL